MTSAPRQSLLPSVIRERRNLSTSSAQDTLPDANTLAAMLRDDLRNAGLYVRVGVWLPPSERGPYDPVSPAFGAVLVFADDAKDSRADITISLHTAIVAVMSREGVTTQIPYAGRGWLAATKAALAAEHAVETLATIKPACS